MMQYVSEGNHIKAFIFYCLQLVDLMAVENKIEIIKVENIAGNDVRIELF